MRRIPLGTRITQRTAIQFDPDEMKELGRELRQMSRSSFFSKMAKWEEAEKRELVRCGLPTNAVETSLRDFTSDVVETPGLEEDSAAGYAIRILTACRVIRVAKKAVDIQRLAKASYQLGVLRTERRMKFEHETNAVEGKSRRDGKAAADERKAKETERLKSFYIKKAAELRKENKHLYRSANKLAPVLKKLSAKELGIARSERTIRGWLTDTAK
jgi:hypothetical protein